MKNNKFHGFGILILSLGYIKYGEFKNGKLDGFGREINGKERYYYEGEFKKGDFHG